MKPRLSVRRIKTSVRRIKTNRLVHALMAPAGAYQANVLFLMVAWKGVDLVHVLILRQSEFIEDFPSIWRSCKAIPFFEDTHFVAFALMWPSVTTMA